MTTTTTAHTATGQSATVATRQVIAWADFSTASGVGTAVLEVEIASGVWVSVNGESYTANPTAGAITTEKTPDATTNMLNFRWNITAYTSGTITTYLKAL